MSEHGPAVRGTMHSRTITLAVAIILGAYAVHLMRPSEGRAAIIALSVIVHGGVVMLLARVQRQTSAANGPLARRMLLAALLWWIASATFRLAVFVPTIANLPIADLLQLCAYAATAHAIAHPTRSADPQARWLERIQTAVLAISVGLGFWMLFVRDHYAYLAFGSIIGPTLEVLYPTIHAVLIYIAFDRSARGNFTDEGLRSAVILVALAGAAGDTILSVDAYLVPSSAIRFIGDAANGLAAIGFLGIASSLRSETPLLRVVESRGIGYDRLPRFSLALLLIVVVMLYSMDASAAASTDDILRATGALLLLILLSVQVRLRGTVALRALEQEQDALRRTLAERTESLRQAGESQLQFITNLSHEIRAPLQACIGITDLLGLRRDLPVEVANDVDRLRLHTEHLGSMTANILDLARIESGLESLLRAPFDLGSVVTQAEDILERSGRAKGLRVSVELDEGIPRFLYGDRTRLAQLVINYITNACKFTEAGGVTVRFRRTSVAPDRVGLTIEVIDTGRGIAPDVQRRLFKRWERLEAHASHLPGSGLGLAISRWIAEQMGGSVGVISVPGRGSTFWCAVVLERDPGRPESTLEASTAGGSAPARTGPARILVVDDSEVARAMATEVLVADGHEVVGVTDGVEALRALSERRFDLILMDVRMPRLDGVETSRIIRRTSGLETIPIIAISAAATGAEWESHREAGMTDFVPKPFHASQLLTTVRRQLHAAFGPSTQASTPVAPDAAPRIDLLRVADLTRIEGLDVQAALTRVMGNDELYRRLLRGFMATAGDEVQTIGQQLQAGSYREAQLGAHRLKGGAGNLGLVSIQGAARRLERRLDEPGRPNWDDAFRALRDEVTTALSALREQMRR